jgi:succinoglycan biosynthesis protein ExoA
MRDENMPIEEKSQLAPLRVSIVTTVLNERESIGQLLDAFLSQTLKPDEIIVVDGGSTDGTIGILREYSNSHDRVRFSVEHGVNIARGRNIAIERSRSEIIAVTDGGCYPERSWLQELVKPLVEDRSFGAVSGKRKISAHNRFESFAGLLSTSTDSMSEENRVFHGRNSAFRKELWSAVGGYPEWLYTAEDTLFAWRARALGCRVAFAPNAVVQWRPRSSFRKLAKQYFLYGRGTGHINQAKLKSVVYHLRNHAIWILALFMGLISPWFWLIAAAMLLYIYATLITPALKRVRAANLDRCRELYVPLIVMIRSFANNLGQAIGLWQYRNVPPYKRNLDLYQAGLWARSKVGGSQL